MADSTVGFQFECRTEAFSPPVAHEEDSALIAGLRAGDECAYEILIQRFEQPVYNLVSRLVDDSADAADVTQEVFLKVFRKVGGFRSESSLKTWVYRIAVNEARNQRRWFTRHRGKEIGLEPAESNAQGPQDWLCDPGRSPYQTALDQETHALIESALQEGESQLSGGRGAARSGGFELRRDLRGSGGFAGNSKVPDPARAGIVTQTSGGTAAGNSRHGVAVRARKTSWGTRRITGE